jgi:hypothetical protein
VGFRARILPRLWERTVIAQHRPMLQIPGPSARGQSVSQ